MFNLETLAPSPHRSLRTFVKQQERVRKGKVDRFRALIASGLYRPSSEDIARALFVSPILGKRK